MVSEKGSEPSFCSGVVAIVVYVEDHGFAIVTFELYCRYVVCAWNTDVLPVLCFEGFADPGHGPYRCTIPTSVFQEDWPEICWHGDGAEVVDVWLLY